MADIKSSSLAENKKTISVLIVEPEKEPYVKEIEDSLDSYQREVGGYIQTVYPFSDPVAIVCNDEGKLMGLPLNRALRDRNGEVYDAIAGNFMIVGLATEDFCSLTDEQVQKFSDYFKTPELFVNYNGKLAVLPLVPEEQEPERKPLSDLMAEAKEKAVAVTATAPTVLGSDEPDLS